MLPKALLYESVVLLQRLLSHKLVVDAGGRSREVSVDKGGDQGENPTHPFFASSSKCLPFSATFPSRSTYCRREK